MRDLNQCGEDSIRFFTQTKVVTQRWPRGGAVGKWSFIGAGGKVLIGRLDIKALTESEDRFRAAGRRRNGGSIRRCR
jgi:hypothetical protein